MLFNFELQYFGISGISGINFDLLGYVDILVLEVLFFSIGFDIEVDLSDVFIRDLQGVFEVLFFGLKRKLEGVLVDYVGDFNYDGNFLRI